MEMSGLESKLCILHSLTLRQIRIMSDCEPCVSFVHFFHTKQENINQNLGPQIGDV